MLGNLMHLRLCMVRCGRYGRRRKCAFFCIERERENTKSVALDCKLMKKARGINMLWLYAQ
jgi:hypothetical protein